MQNNQLCKEEKEYRFSSTRQPSRTPTMKQQAKELEKLLVMSYAEVEAIAKTNDTPVYLRSAALSLIKGNVDKVINLIAEYRKISKRKEVV